MQSLFSSIFPHLQTQDDTPAPIPVPSNDDQIAELTAIGDAAKQGKRYVSPVQPAIPPQTATPDERTLIDQPADRSTAPAMQTSPTPTLTLPDTMTRPEPVDAKGKPPRKPLDRPGFNLPYPDPQSNYEQTKNALAMGQYDAQHPQNQDHGVKGFLKEMIGNFLTGLAETPRGANVKQALLLGGAGAGAGVLNRGWNERRVAEAALPQLEKNVKLAGDDEMLQSKIADTKHDNAVSDQEFARKVNKDQVDAEYKENLIGLGTEKANNIKSYREAILDLKAQGVRQADKRITALENRIKEEVRHNQATENLTDKKIASTEKIADANRGSRERVAGANQDNANYRTLVTNGNQASKVLLALDNMPANKGESPEAFAARKAEARKKFLDSLPGDVKATINQ